jgi:dTMP kinase
VGLGRTNRRPSVEGRPREDRFERETIEFHEKIRAGFLAMARAEPARFRIIDAARAAAEVAREIQRIADQEIL